MADGFAYVIDELSSNTAVLRVVDVSNPAAPMEVGRFDIPSRGVDVKLENGFAYLTVSHLFSGISELWALDVSDPTSPVKVGAIASGGLLEVEGGFAYLSSDKLRVIDVSDPTALVEVGAVDSGGGDVEVDGDFAYVTVNFGSLRVIDVSNPTQPIELGTLTTLGAARGIDESGIEAGDADACISGEMIDGVPFLGCAAIETVPH